MEYKGDWLKRETIHPDIMMGYVVSGMTTGTNRSILHFCNGKLEGMWTEYDEEGTLLILWNSQTDWRRDFGSLFHDNGQLKFEGTFAMTLRMVGIFGETVLDELLREIFFAKGREVH